MKLFVLRPHIDASQTFRDAGSTYDEPNPDYAKQRIEHGIVREHKASDTAPAPPKGEKAGTKPTKEVKIGPTDDPAGASEPTPFD